MARAEGCGGEAAGLRRKTKPAQAKQEANGKSVYEQNCSDLDVFAWVW
jgi:hypothetical protein